MSRNRPRKEPQIPQGKVSLQGAAEFLGVSRHKVARLVKKGTLRSEKFDLDERVVLFDMGELKYLKEGATNGSGHRGR
jgi:excisionase family DNA binding protein